MKKLFALGLLVAGCAHAQSANVVDLSSSPSQRIAKLEQMLSQRNRVQVEMQQHIDTLQQELNELRGNSETQDHRLNQILQRQRELYQELDKLSSRLNSRSPVTQPSVATDTNITLSESDAYKHAINLALKQQRYDDAIGEFEKYLIDYPQSSFRGNVHYWLGQLYFRDGKKDLAKNQLEKLVTNFPKSSKRVEGLIRLGRIAQDAKKRSKAIAYYQQAIKEYPNSSAAQIAQTRLKSLKK
ncbi:MAG: tol-pal system protein YbgF [Psychrobium sp.]|nr:tol-pal system protein YbgF [Psychrobium sp.]